MSVTVGAPLYAVVEQKPIIWQVIAFENGHPAMVPIGKWRLPFEESDIPEWEPVPVTSGEAWMPSAGMTVMYAPDYASLLPVIMPWMEVGGDGE